MENCKCYVCGKEMLVLILTVNPPIKRYECSCGRRVDEQEKVTTVLK